MHSDIMFNEDVDIIVKPLIGSVNKWSTIKFLITNFELPEGYNNVQCVISEISEDYTLWKMTIGGEINNNGDLIVSFKPNYQLEHGFYIINSLEFFKSSNPEDRLILSSRSYLFYPFEVIKITEKKQPNITLLRNYNKIIRNRKNEFFSGLKYNINADIPLNEYMTYVFVKDCLITSRMRFGSCCIIPFDGLEFNDEINLINKFLQRNNMELFGVDEIIQRARNGQPTVIMWFPNILAPSVDIARNIAVNETEHILNVLTIHRDSSGSIFGTYIIDKLKNQSHFEVDTPAYRGNLMGGFISGEYMPEIKKHVDKSKNDRLIQLYLSMYREALKEKSYEFSYFRFWNILETISNNLVKEDDYIYDGNGNIKNNNNGDFIQGKNANAFNLVFETLRRSHTSMNHNFDVSRIEKNITIWNRRRNCIAHYGGCFPENPKVCQINHVKPHQRHVYTTCKDARDEMINQYGNTYQDDYLESLKNATLNVIRYILK